MMRSVALLFSLVIAQAAVDETDSEPEPVTHSINPWTFGMDNAKPLAVEVGDFIQFTWSGNHNVQQLSDIDDCSSWTGSILPISGGTSTYTVQANDGGKTIHFACEVGSHCSGGMKRSFAVAGDKTDEPDPTDDTESEPEPTDDTDTESEPEPTDDTDTESE